MPNYQNKKQPPNMNLVSVLMAVKNSERTLSCAISSILNQTYKNFEFIIIDDGSTDKTWDILKGLIDDRLKLKRNERSYGLAFSLNKAFHASSGEYLARMDADDEAFPFRLEAQVSFLNRDAGIDIVGSCAVIKNEQGRIFGVRKVETDHVRMIENIFQEVPFIHPTVMMRRKVLSDLGGYNPNLLKAQDWDLWLRARRKFVFANLPEPLLYYTQKSNRPSVKDFFLVRRTALQVLHSRIKEERLSKTAYSIWTWQTLKATFRWLIGTKWQHPV